MKVSSTLAVVALAVLPAAARLSAAPPPNFADQLVASIGGPTALAFTPDGRLLVTTQGGTLRVVSGGTLLPTPALSLGTRVCSNGERGLLGVAVDPQFGQGTNRFVYLYYTFNGPTGCVNRLSRFVLPDTNVMTVSSETVLVDNMPSTAGNHNAGDVKFGKDGTLFATIGDGGCDYAGDSGCAGANDASRDEQTLTGKLLRINKDGSIPADNPFRGAGTARCNVTGRTSAGMKCQETFAWGFRNPFRFAVDPNDAGNRIFVNDVGQGAWEEIDVVQAGGDYGWNCREGAHVNSSSGKCSPTPAGMIDPIFEYTRSVLVPGTSVAGCGSITGGAFVPNGSWPGYDGKYLFADYNCGGIFTLAGGGTTWTAADFATGLGASSAVTLVFGPYGNGQALYYTTYAAGGQVRRIRYSPNGNDPPQPAIASPALGATFRVGQTVTLTGSAMDLQDGPIPNSSLSWTVLLHQGAQTTTYFGPATGNNLTFSAPAPADLTAATNSFLEIRLTATDSLGGTTTISRDFQPNAQPLLLATSPAGLSLTVNGSAVTGPTTVTAWEGWNLTVATASPQTGPGGAPYLFNSWTDGGTQSHVFVMPAVPSGLTASFVKQGGTKFFTLAPCRALDTRSGPPLQAGVGRNVTLAGLCGIPADATAVSVNLAVTQPTGPGYLSAVPPGLALAPTSILNVLAGQTRANSATLSLLGSPAGVVTLMPGLAFGTVHVVVDVNGFYR